MKIKSTRLIVGMEIHVELATNSKMFTGAPNAATPEHYDAQPNTLVDPLVMALPGSLPVLNKRAVAMSMRVGLALNCTVAKFTKWDRKNYFYPDLPKGYQISQYDKPLCVDGVLEIEVDGEKKPIRITRAHLEEDTGKLAHELPGGEHYEGSLVDLNRAGTPLLEIVSEPDMSSADEAVAYGQEVRVRVEKPLIPPENEADTFTVSETGRLSLQDDGITAILSAFPGLGNLQQAWVIAMMSDDPSIEAVTAMVNDPNDTDFQLSWLTRFVNPFVPDEALDDTLVLLALDSENETVSTVAKWVYLWIETVVATRRARQIGGPSG